MSNPLRKLASQTAVYGLSSILGRFLNYLLVPLHTAQFSALQFGIITEMYAYVAFLVVLLTYGMETAYFRFSSTAHNHQADVYRTTVTSLMITTVFFIGAIVIFSVPISEFLKYPNHTEYVIWFAIIVGLDAITSIPLARLRAENKAAKFALVNLTNIAANIGLNVFFVGYCMSAWESGTRNVILETCYNPEIGVGYVFIANLIASILKFALLLPMMLRDGLGIRLPLLSDMLRYAVPLLLAGLAGIVNETLDRILIKRILWDKLGETETLTQLGIYGACYKVSIIVTLFIQAFRYAAEPFFFAQEKVEGSGKIYSKVMTYFVIVCGFIFLAVMLYLDIIRYFLQNKALWAGLHVVPILLLANIMLGIYFNLSIWYKLSGKTGYGAAFSVFGALITIVLNLILIPMIGYTGSAWATLICYFAMCVASYLLGRRYHAIEYEVLKISAYLLSAVGLYAGFSLLNFNSVLISHLTRVAILITFIALIYIGEKFMRTSSVKSSH